MQYSTTKTNCDLLKSFHYLLVIHTYPGLRKLPNKNTVYHFIGKSLHLLSAQKAELIVFTNGRGPIILCYILIFLCISIPQISKNHLPFGTLMHSAIVQASIWYRNVLHIQRRRDFMEEKPYGSKKWKLPSKLYGNSRGTAEKLATCANIY